MKYPKLPKEQYNKKILTESEVKNLQVFYKSNKNIRLTARKFGVSRHTVKYHTNPEFKDRELKASHARKFQKYHSDPEYREHIKKKVKENQVGLRAKNPLISKYAVEKQKERYAKLPEVRSRISIRNSGYHRKRKLEVMEKYWSKKTKQQFLQAYIKHKESIEFMLKKEPLLILFK